MRTAVLTALATALLSTPSLASTGPDQAFFGKPTIHDEGEWTTFARPIRNVAVIGAGPNGLQHAAALIKEGFSVHLIDRSDAPGGNWHHNVLTPVREAYPNLPLHIGAFKPDVRDNATVKFYEDGDEGLTLDERWREHSRPSPIWDDLTTNSAPVFTTLPGVTYPDDATWELPGYLVQRHVRSYASSQGLNVGDEHYNSSAPVFLRYSTRLELLEKDGHSWKLSLRALTRLPENKQIKAEWTVEHFDAVVIASGGYDAPYVPPTKGLIGWSKVHKDGHYPLHHSQSYRNPNLYKGKTVLIVGASVSASEISRRVGPHVEKLYISIRNTTRSTYMQRRSIRRLSPFAEIIPEVIEYGHLDSEHELAGGSVTVVNGTTISGIDEVILATGFLRSMPFLKEYRSIQGQASSDRPPIVTNGHTLSALAWTGHYIADPTLAFATVRPWTLGRYQALGFAKVWKGTARLPSESRLWDDYHNNNHWGGGSKVVFGTLEEESLGRQWVTWLNHESLIHGGRLVDQWPIEWRERFVYYAEQAWEAGYTTTRNFTEYENTPKAEWPTYPVPHDALIEAESAEFVDGVSEW